MVIFSPYINFKNVRECKENVRGLNLDVLRLYIYILTLLH